MKADFEKWFIKETGLRAYEPCVVSAELVNKFATDFAENEKKEIANRLQDKHDAFIGNQKDQITSANAKGFKQGLAWAIDSIKT